MSTIQFSKPTYRLTEYFKDYASYHQNHKNQIFHTFGITFILIGLFGILSRLILFATAQSELVQIDGATVLIIFGLIWYSLLDWKITIPFSLILFGLYFLARTLPGYVSVSLFFMGWVFQGIGHAIFEKKSPAFLNNLTHLLIGPLWVFAKMIGYR
jgi:uncharacterized membrane protein YGL010W